MRGGLLTLALAVAAAAGPLRASGAYPVASIPEELKAGAWSVVRYSNEHVTVSDAQNATHKTVFVVTILDKDGEGAGLFRFDEDRFGELHSFKAEVFNAQGAQIRKASKSDLGFSGYSPHIAVEGKVYYYSPSVPVYPYTVRYEYETRLKNGIIGLPSFAPMAGFRNAVEKASYSLIVPSGIEIRYHPEGGAPQASVIKSPKGELYRWEMENVAAVRREEMTPNAARTMPRVVIVPRLFTFDRIKGDMTDWTTFGEWQNKLLEGRGTLDPGEVARIREIAAGASTDREKVKLLYEYLQAKSRYVLIALGIGGWQPFPASEVSKTGFGDCKGLSNYMMAILEAAEIPSFYTIIHTGGRREVRRNFANRIEFNHAILTVPFEKDTVYLECTSNDLPFGYTHDGIAGHDAWLIQPGNSRIITLPRYADSLSATYNNVVMEIAPNGTATVGIKARYTMDRCDDMRSFIRETDPTKRTDRLARKLIAQKPSVSILSVKEERTEAPALDVEYRAICEDYAKTDGGRLIVRFNPMGTPVPLTKSNTARKFDIELEDGMFFTDSITVKAPAGYECKSPPSPKHLESAFGSIQIDVERQGEDLLCVQSLKIRRGVYHAGQYADLRAFVDEVNRLQGTLLFFEKK